MEINLRKFKGPILASNSRKSKKSLDNFSSSQEILYEITSWLIVYFPIILHECCILFSEVSTYTDTIYVHLLNGT